MRGQGDVDGDERWDIFVCILYLDIHLSCCSYLIDYLNVLILNTYIPHKIRGTFSLHSFNFSY